LVGRRSRAVHGRDLGANWPEITLRRRHARAVGVLWPPVSAGDLSHARVAGRPRGYIRISVGNQLANSCHWEGVDRVSGGFATGAAPRDGRLPMSTSQGAGGPDLSVSFAGIPLKNPVIAASGTFAYGVAFEDIVHL